MSMESPSFEKIDFKEQAHELRERLKSMMYQEEKRNKIWAFTRELQTRHSIDELHDYEAYCALAGSTPLKEPEYFDLPGNDSIIQFVENLENEIEEKKE